MLLIKLNIYPKTFLNAKIFLVKLLLISYKMCPVFLIEKLNNYVNGKIKDLGL